jgi:predicted GNAT family N-acyltransferase
MENLNVRHIKDVALKEMAYAVRREVFVVEQEVAPDDEFDEFEENSRHFLVSTDNGKAVGTARWRFTDSGIKLERFAVLKEYRGKGIGAALVQAVMDDIRTQTQNQSVPKVYMHAQLRAMPLYNRFGFKQEGEQFVECGIQHYTMVWEEKTGYDFTR